VATSWWRWRARVIGFDGEPDLAVDWFAPLALHRHSPYPRKFRKDDLRVRITVHSDTYARNGDALTVSLLNSLRGFHQHDLLNLILTPLVSERPEWSQELDEIAFGKDLDAPMGIKFVGVQCGNTWTSTTAELPTAYDLARIIGHPPSEEETHHLQSIWHVLGAHRALSRDVFLTDDAVLIKYRQAIGATYPSGY
jgi:hypothetical protein